MFGILVRWTVLLVALRADVMDATCAADLKVIQMSGKKTITGNPAIVDLTIIQYRAPYTNCYLRTTKRGTLTFSHCGLNEDRCSLLQVEILGKEYKVCNELTTEVAAGVDVRLLREHLHHQRDYDGVQYSVLHSDPTEAFILSCCSLHKICTSHIPPFVPDTTVKSIATTTDFPSSSSSSTESGPTTISVASRPLHNRTTTTDSETDLTTTSTGTVNTSMSGTAPRGLAYQLETQDGTDSSLPEVAVITSTVCVLVLVLLLILSVYWRRIKARRIRKSSSGVYENMELKKEQIETMKPVEEIEGGNSNIHVVLNEAFSFPLSKDNPYGNATNGSVKDQSA